MNRKWGKIGFILILLGFVFYLSNLIWAWGNGISGWYMPSILASIIMFDVGVFFSVVMSR